MRPIVGVGYDEDDGGIVYDALGEAVHGSKGWLAGGGTEGNWSYGFLNLRIHMGVIVRVCKRPNGLAIRAPRTRHERYDSCFGYRRSRVRSPVRPTLIFLSLGGYATRETPL